jgi:Fur family ferric uptake transcriptional regulator
VFELEQGEHHDHLVCIKCGKVDEFIDSMIERRQEVIAKQSGFKMTDHSLTIYGVCSQCADEKVGPG